MSNQDLIKTSLINEIEENSTTSSRQKSKSLQDDVRQLCSQHEKLISSFALQKASEHGIDPRYVLISQLPKYSNNPIQVNKENLSGATNDLLEVFANEINLKDYEESVDPLQPSKDSSDEGEYSGRERMQNFTIPREVFNPFGMHIRFSRPNLYQIYSQHSLLQNNQKSKRKHRSSRKDKRERSKAMAGNSNANTNSRPNTRSNARSRPSIVETPPLSPGDMPASAIADPPPPPLLIAQEVVSPTDPKCRKDLAAVVGKCVAEGTAAAYLITVCLLLRVWKEENNSNQSLSFQLESHLPMANLLLPYLKSTIVTTGSDSSVHNGYESLISEISSQLADSLSNNLLMTSGVSPSIYTRELKDYIPGASEYAKVSPSAAPAVTTMTSTSAMDEVENNNEDGSDEIDEEALLAEALALSMSRQTSEDLPQTMDTTTTTSSNEGLIEEQSSSLPISSMDTEKQNSKYLIQLLSSFGLLCQSDIFPEHFQMDLTKPVITNASLRQAIVILLTVLGVAADEVLQLDSAPVQSTFLTHPATTVSSSTTTPAGATNAGKSPRGNTDISGDKDQMNIKIAIMGGMSKQSLDKLKSDMNDKSNRQVSLTPEKITFHLIEYLLDFLVIELKNHSNIPLEAESDAAILKEWKFYRFFLVWSISIVLKLFHAELMLSHSSKVSLTELGLSKSSSTGLVVPSEFILSSSPELMPEPSITPSASSVAPNWNTPVVSRVIENRTISSPSPMSGSQVMSGVSFGTTTSGLPQRLLSLLSECMGLDPAIFGDHKDFISQSLLVDSNASKLNFGISQQYSTVSESLHQPEFYRHELRLAGMDAFIVANMLLTNGKGSSDLDKLLLSLLESSPAPTDTSLTSFLDIAKSSVLTLDTATQSLQRIESNDLSIYNYIFLQKLCNHKMFLDMYWSRNMPHTNTLNVESISINNTQSPQNMSMFNSRRLKPKIQDVRDHPRSKIEKLLLQRLGNSELQKSKLLSAVTTTAVLSPDVDSYINYIGELNLLKKIQKNYLSECIDTRSSSPTLSFNSIRCNSSIILSEENGTATFKSWNKAWATVVGVYKQPPKVSNNTEGAKGSSNTSTSIHRNNSQSSDDGITPNSGIHEWSVKIHRVDQSRLFVGVVTSDASTDTYIGGDSHGWGFIGTRSLWHDKKKVAEFGPTFGTGSTAHLRLNSDTGTLYISTPQSNEWTLIKDNLPSVVLYPAVSMHHKDDRVSITLRSITSSQNPSESIAVIRQKQFKFVAYSQVLCASIDTILTDAEKSIVNKDGRFENILCHPFISYLLPSLIATILTVTEESQIGGFFTVQMLPFFIILSKRMTKVFDLYHGMTHSPRDRTLATNVCNPSGHWNCRSASVGGSCQYYMAIEASSNSSNTNSGSTDPSGESDNNDDDDEENSKTGNVLAIRGVGQISGSTSFTVLGTLVGSECRYCETMESGQFYEILAQLSLCGCFLEGHFKSKSGNSDGVLTCFRLPIPFQSSSASSIQSNVSSCLTADSTVLSVLRNCSLLCTTMAGKFSSCLVSGFKQHLLVSDKESDEPGESDDIIDDSPELYSSETPLDMTTSGKSAQGKDSNSAHVSVSTWLTSDLLSGGLPLTSNLLLSLANEMMFFMDCSECFTMESIFGQPSSTSMIPASLIHPEFIYSELVSWWVGRSMTLLKPFIIEVSSGSYQIYSPEGKLDSSGLTYSMKDEYQQQVESELGVRSESNIKPFVEAIMKDTDEFRELDNYLLQHMGQLAVKRIGGEALSETRKLILSCIIHHSGCDSVCLSESSLLTTGIKSKSDRPSAILRDIWRSAQRVTDAIIREKQISGGTFAAVCQPYRQKAEFLLGVEPNSVCRVISEYILSNKAHDMEILTEDSDNLLCVSYFSNNATTDIEKNLYNDCINQLNTVVKFLTSSLKDLPMLHSHMKNMAFRTISRIAGFKSIMMLYQKLDDLPTAVPATSVLSNCYVQPAALEYLISSLHRSDNFELPIEASPPSASDPSDTAQSTGSSNANNNDTVTTSFKQGNMDGHYTVNLRSVNSLLITELTRSFELLYEFIAQLLSRSTWSADRNVQCVALTCWGVTVSIDDHFFLNRIGIFRILQSVLEDTRGSGDRINSFVRRVVEKQQKSVTVDSNTAIVLDKYTQYGAEILLGLDKKLAHLVIRIVHSLASQVAYSIDSKSQEMYRLPSNRLQRMPSGPDTLSQSLFEMLFAELFFGLKSVLSNSSKNATSTSTQIPASGQDQLPFLKAVFQNQSLLNEFSSNNLSRNDSKLKGDEYIYRILRLLHSVSNSTVCQKSLSTPRWISLLLMMIGCGNVSVQRRLFRLLRTLITSVQPESFSAYVPQFDALQNELVASEMPFDEEEVQSWMHNDPMLTSTHKTIWAERLIEFFVDTFSVLYPSTESSNSADAELLQRRNSLISKLYEQNTVQIVSGESLATIRKLYSIPGWRSVVDSVLQKLLSQGVELADILNKNMSMGSTDTHLMDSKFGRLEILRKATASLAVLGAYIDRIRLGGLVSLRHFHPSEPLAGKMANTSNRGIVISLSSSTVELILIEKTENTSSLNTHGHDDFSAVSPLALARVGTTDVRADSLIPFTDESASLSMFEQVSKSLLTSTEAVLQSLINRKDKESSKPTVITEQNPTASGAHGESTNAESPDEGHRHHHSRRMSTGDESDSRGEIDAEMEVDEDEDYEDEHTNDDEEDDDEDHDGDGHDHGPELLVEDEASQNNAVVEENDESRQGMDIDNNTQASADISHKMSVDAAESISGTQYEQNIKNMQASEYLFHTSSFRAATTTLQNDQFSEAFLRQFCTNISSGLSPPTSPNASLSMISGNRMGEFSPALIPNLLSLAIVSPDSGSLAVVEHIEERWVALWDEICTIDSGVVPLTASSSGVAVDKSTDASRPVSKTQSSTSISVSNPNASAHASVSGGASDSMSGRPQLLRPSSTLESAARAGLLPFGSHAYSRAPPPAEMNGMIAQMTDMGLPREWCEAALRRCRYNIEMAINMCFESGIDMAQIVAEEAARSAVEPPAGLISATSRPSTRREESGDGASLSFLGQALLGIRPSGMGGLPPGLAASLGISGSGSGSGSGGSNSGGSGSAASRRGERIESDGSRVQQLLDMGFPPHWCTLAMRATNNNVDAALGWIFAHGDELVNDPVSITDSSAIDEETSGSGAMDVEGQNVPVLVSLDRPIFNPLSPVSGSCDIRDDLHCICNPSLGNFPSVGCRGFGVSSGKWYYEVTLITAGCIQLGWADGAYKGSAINGQGVGDCSHSWAFDGWRVHTWHEASSDWGARWSVGDVVGCAVDLDNLVMSFYLNGFGKEIGMGVAFENFEYSEVMYPCLSFNNTENVQFNFGSVAFKQTIPEGYQPFSTHVNACLLDIRNHVQQLRNPSLAKHLPVFEQSKEGARRSLTGLESRMDEESMGHSIKVPPVFENALDEVPDEREMSATKRYFSVDSTKNDRNISTPTADFPSSSIPRGNRAKVLKQFVDLSQDLIILYSRIIIFRLISSLPRLSDQLCHDFIMLLHSSHTSSTPPDALKRMGSQDGESVASQRMDIALESPNMDDVNSTQNSAFDMLLTLIRLNSITTNKTRLYLQLSKTQSLTISSSNYLFSVGGAPFLHHIADGFKQLFRTHTVSGTKILNTFSSTNIATDFVFKALDQLLLDTTNSLRRDLSSDWINENGLAPVTSKSNVNEISSYSHPSLVFAVWTTFTLMECFVSRFSKPLQKVSSSDMHTDSTDDKDSIKSQQHENDVSEWLVKLVHHWCVALRSPNIYVKLSAMRMLSFILQEVHLNGQIFHSYHLPLNLSEKLYNIMPIKRLKKLARRMIAGERRTLPVVSEFLQVMIELCLSTDQLRPQAIVNSSTTTNSNTDDVPIVSTAMSSEDCEMEQAMTQGEVDINNCEYNWELISGHLISDASQDWQVWSGSVKPDVVFENPNDSRLSRRHDSIPPVLLPGGRVSQPWPVEPVTTSTDTRTVAAIDEDDESPPPAKKTVRLTSAASSDSVESSDGSSDANIPPDGSVADDISVTSPVEAAPTTTDASTTTIAPTPTLATKPSRATPERYGTVIGVCKWTENHPEGSARMIKWDDSEENEDPEKVRWGADGVFDVVHWRVEKSKMKDKYPLPQIVAPKMAANDSVSFGILLRYRLLTNTESTSTSENNLVGMMEWPDFHTVVYVTGKALPDGSLEFTEQRIIKGINHTTWLVRFGRSMWAPGSTYQLARVSDTANYGDPTDNQNVAMTGTYRQTLFRDGKEIFGCGQINLQCSRLFQFDTVCHASSAGISLDKLTVSKLSSSGGQVCAYGTVGFSSGVHYWEYKIETADLGTVYVGVGDKPGYPGAPKNLFAEKCARWSGYGYLNNRAVFKARIADSEDNMNSYGEHFHSGDVVGVLLDMNRGRVSFYLDGMKYGEHIIADLGEAFDNLAAPNATQLRTLYPVVGVQRSNDRVTITPRWLSSTGLNADLEYAMVGRAWKLMTHWSIVRPSSSPIPDDMWIYRAAWRDWLSWRTQRFHVTASRFKAYGVTLALDSSPISLVEASIRLGLPKALFRGDRLQFSKSSGRSLEMKEEAVVLGAYNGRIWYRLDNNQTVANSLRDNAGMAWFLTPNDIEGLVVLSKFTDTTSSHPDAIPAVIADIPLSRIPIYRGGLLLLSHDGEAVMRNGLEIDSSDKICSIPTKSIVFAIERRINASNIARYKVIYGGSCGWISERMRGSTEDIMLVRHNATPEHEATERDNAVIEAAALGLPDRVIWEESQTIKDAMDSWEVKVNQSGNVLLLETWKSQKSLSSTGQVSINDNITGSTFQDFVTLAATSDGKRNWSVEEDMQLSELISKTAYKEGVQPQNLSIAALQKAIVQVKEMINISTSGSLFTHIDITHAIARASILRVANRVIGLSLPYFNITLPEELWRTQCTGVTTDFDIIPTSIPPPPSSSAAQFNQSSIGNRTLLSSSSVTNNDSEWNLNGSGSGHWSPPCLARRLRSFRRLVFNQTKMSYWEAVLDATTTATSLHQDEYEDAREIQTVSINRVKAVHSKLATISNVQDRVKLTVFGQLRESMRKWSDHSFRRAYLGKGHGGQKRAFKVKFLGEGVNDYGGPYRAVFEQIADEMQGELLTTGSSNQCLIPLLVPCANRSASVGANQDKFVLSTATPSTSTLDNMTFFGKLIGMAIRHNLSMGLDLSTLVWRPMVALPLSRAHLETIDTLTVKTLDSITATGLKLESEMIAKNSLIDTTYIPEEWTDLTFSVTLPDGSRQSLITGGETVAVKLGNWRQYVELAEKVRLKESLALFRSFRDGVSSVLPAELMPLFTSTEIEHLFTGTRKVDVTLLQKCAEYDNVDPESPHIKFFWEVVEEMTEEELTSLLRFVWARSRMPSSQHLSMNFKLQAPQGDARENPDIFLPHAQTCFFSLSLPAYSSKEILRSKLLYAINNSPNMDADVRLHSAEGWADS